MDTSRDLFPELDAYILKHSKSKSRIKSEIPIDSTEENPYIVKLNDVDISTWVSDINLNVEVDFVDITTLGSAFPAPIKGVESWTLNLELDNAVLNSFPLSIKEIFDSGDKLDVLVGTNRVCYKSEGRISTYCEVIDSFKINLGIIGVKELETTTIL